VEPVAFYLPDANTSLPIFDDGWSQWVEYPDSRREYGIWYMPRGEASDAPIVVGAPADEDF
jgi:hypothetical protein